MGIWREVAACLVVEDGGSVWAWQVNVANYADSISSWWGEHRVALSIRMQPKDALVLVRSLPADQAGKAVDAVIVVPANDGTTTRLAVHIMPDGGTPYTDPRYWFVGLTERNDQSAELWEFLSAEPTTTTEESN